MSANLHDTLDGDITPDGNKLIPLSAVRICNGIIVPRISANLNGTPDGENAPKEIHQDGTNLCGRILQLHNRSADEG